MILNVKTFSIEGLKLFSIKNNKDNRGNFSEVFLTNSGHSEFKINYIQENESISKYGIFRGMHFQKGKYSQNKLIRVIKGKVIDVICDLRKNSPTFKKTLYIDLVPYKILFVPIGIAHGFLSLDNETILNYKCDNYYNPAKEGGFNIFKSNLKEKIPFNFDDIIISEKDKNLPSINQTYIFNKL